MRDAIIPKAARIRDVTIGAHPSRKVFHCLVLGNNASGKTSFLNTFIKAGSHQTEPPLSSNQLQTTETKCFKSVVKAVREKDSKNKEKTQIKYLILTEVPDEAVTSGRLFKDHAHLLYRCDVLLFLFEAGDRDQVDFVKDTHAKLSQLKNDYPDLAKLLKFVPQVLI